MKKMFKAAAVLAAAMMVMGFVSCSDSDDSDDIVLPANGSGGETSSGGSSSDGSGTSSGGSGSQSSTGTPINFDALDTSTEIGAALLAVGDTTTAALNFTAGTYDGVTLIQAVAGDLVKPKGDTSVQLKKNAATASFEVTSGAKIIISASSSGSGKKTYYTVTGAADGAATVSDSGTFTDNEFVATADGTVTITPTKFQEDGSTNNNNLRILKIIVTY